MQSRAQIARPDFVPKARYSVRSVMPRQNVIVGIGEALQCEFPDRVEPGGLAIHAARHAQRLGHVGIAVSRLGQDLTANELLTELKGWGLSIDHLQSDPDLPTGRMIVRSIAGQTKRSLQPRAAFDNLQWDFDLEDVALQADAVVFGLLAQRDGQSESVIRRFLGECSSALRVFDMTSREDNRISRSTVRTSLERVEIVVADRAALQSVTPGWDGNNAREAALRVLRGGTHAFVITIETGDCTERMTAHTADASIEAPRAYPSAQHVAALIGLVHGVLSGWDLAKSLDIASSVADHAKSHPTDQAPTEIL